MFTLPFPEDPRKLLVIVSHHLGLEHLLGEGHDEAMDVLHSLIGLHPELHVDSSIQFLPLLALPALGPPLGLLLRVRSSDRLLDLDGLTGLGEASYS